MKSGIELIAQERQEQIEKHKRTVSDDVKNNDKHQLSFAAQMLAHPKSDIIDWSIEVSLQGWNKPLWDKMNRKPYKERLIIAGALIAAEIDRLQSFKP